MKVTSNVSWVFPVTISIYFNTYIFFPFWQRIYRCRFSNPNCQISFRESCGKLNHLLVSWFLDNYLSSTEFCVYMFLCVWVCVCYVVGEGLRLCNLETSPVSSILQWFARCGYLVSSMLQMWMWVPCLMMIETETYWLRLALLQRHIYGLKGRNIDVFAENSSLAINPHYIQSWLDLLSRTPRVAPFLQKNDPFIAALKKVWTVPTNDFISLTRFPVFLRTMTLVFWCRNYPNTLLMYMFKMMPLMACSLSMMPQKQL